MVPAKWSGPYARDDRKKWEISPQQGQNGSEEEAEASTDDPFKEPLKGLDDLNMLWHVRQRIVIHNVFGP